MIIWNNLIIWKQTGCMIGILLISHSINLYLLCIMCASLLSELLCSHQQLAKVLSQKTTLRQVTARNIENKSLYLGRIAWSQALFSFSLIFLAVCFKYYFLKCINEHLFVWSHREIKALVIQFTATTLLMARNAIDGISLDLLDVDQLS